MNELAAIVREARAALNGGKPAVLATVVAVRGSAYRRPGARMLVTGDGWRAGSISGGCLEADLARQAAFLVSHGRALVRSYDTAEDAGARLGCGGEVDVLLEPLTSMAFLDVLARVTQGRESIDVRTAIETRTGEREVRVGGALVHSTTTAPLDGVRCFEERIDPSPRLLVVGAGHDAMPVARLADELGWWVDVYDWRPGLLTQERFPTASRCLASASELSSRLQVEPGVVAVVMAHHLDYDAAALAVLLREESVSSIGLLGPRHRSAQVLALVESRARLTEAQRSRLKAPVGLDLGAEGPAAIALSIIAEAQASLTGRTGVPLSARETAAEDAAEHG